MKKRILLGALLIATLSAEESAFKLGIGGKVGSDGYGATGRVWLTEHLGLSLNAGTTFEEDEEKGSLQLNYRFQTQKKLNPYLFLGGGIRRVNILETAPPTFNHLLGMATGGAGLEFYPDTAKRHGFSLEFAVHPGTVTYNGTATTAIGEAEQRDSKAEKELTPVSAKLLYHFYLLPRAERDRDGDGLLDSEDQCPQKAEDMDGFKDEDGCPDLDNDGDGIADSDDKCPAEAEDKDSFEDEDGCPDLDNDGDGIADDTDKCPAKAEDKDGFEDADGCPDLDNDGDGIADSDDKCPDEAESANGFEDEDGCFDSVAPPVEEVQKQLDELPNESIQFELNSYNLAESSFGVLNSLVAILEQWPAVKVNIEGHTDNSGADFTNKVVSEKRAQAIVDYLVEKAITADRLQAVGHGESQPKFDNETLEGRKKNRRVEIECVR